MRHLYHSAASLGLYPAFSQFGIYIQYFLCDFLGYLIALKQLFLNMIMKKLQNRFV